MSHPKVNFARTRKQSRCIVSESGRQHSRVYYNGTHIRRTPYSGLAGAHRFSHSCSRQAEVFTVRYAGAIRAASP
jgi:hypothetical protein